LRGHEPKRVLLTVSYSRSIKIYLAEKMDFTSSKNFHLIVSKTLLGIMSSIPPFCIFMNNEKILGIEG